MTTINMQYTDPASTKHGDTQPIANLALKQKLLQWFDHQHVQVDSFFEYEDVLQDKSEKRVCTTGCSDALFFSKNNFECFYANVANCSIAYRPTPEFLKRLNSIDEMERFATEFSSAYSMTLPRVFVYHDVPFNQTLSGDRDHQCMECSLEMFEIDYLIGGEVIDLLV